MILTLCSWGPSSALSLSRRGDKSVGRGTLRVNLGVPLCCCRILLACLLSCARLHHHLHRPFALLARRRRKRRPPPPTRQWLVEAQRGWGRQDIPADNYLLASPQSPWCTLALRGSRKRKEGGWPKVNARPPALQESLRANTLNTMGYAFPPSVGGRWRRSLISPWELTMSGL